MMFFYGGKHETSLLDNRNLFWEYDVRTKCWKVTVKLNLARMNNNGDIHILVTYNVKIPDIFPLH